MDKISLVGLGKLGICLAVSYAKKGVKVLGVDIERSIVDNVNNKKAPWFEPNLEHYLEMTDNLEATTDLSRAVLETDLTIILVATPSNPDGSFSNRFIEKVLSDIATFMVLYKKPFHSFVISSTVMPLSIERSFIPLLEKKLNTKVNEGFTICYDPDFVALGNVIHGFLSPDFVLIGESCKAAGNELEILHSKMCDNHPPVHRMSLINAELSKVALNAYITTKISFANSLAQLCEKIPGANVDCITNAIGEDRRIGKKYFKGGTAFGGTCFPRDVHAYISLAESIKSQAFLVEDAKKINTLQNENLVETVLYCSKTYANNHEGAVGIIGASFVPNTPVVVESPSLYLAKRLVLEDKHVIICDPVALDSTKSVLGSTVQYVDSIVELVAKVDVLVLMHNSPEHKMQVETWCSKVSSAFVTVKCIVDCWRLLDSYHLLDDIKYIGMGSYSS